MSRLAAELSALVEDELRAFNVERLYAGEKAASRRPAIVEAARHAADDGATAAWSSCCAPRGS